MHSIMKKNQFIWFYHLLLVFIFYVRIVARSTGIFLTIIVPRWRIWPVKYMSSGSELFELLQYRNSHTCLRCLSEPCRKLRCWDCLIRVYSINVVIHVFFDFWKFSIILFNFLINCLDSSFSLYSQYSCKIRVYYF